jgi:hypothetical protein
MGARDFLDALLASRLPASAIDWLKQACAEIEDDTSAARFCSLFSLASRHGTKGMLKPTDAELSEAGRRLEGWNPERWSVLEALRSLLLLSHPGLAGGDGVPLLEEAFRYADVGESCALYRSLALLPEPERFRWRAGEGARSNMRAVFEATCCDTPYPARFFDDIAWNQAVIKAIFVEAPLWRIHGLDGRLSAELARMALDLAEERRSAGRPVNPQLWICLGEHAGERGTRSLERELAGNLQPGRAAAAIALVRAGRGEHVRNLVVDEADPSVQLVMQSALDGYTDQRAFRSLDLPLQAT